MAPVSYTHLQMAVASSDTSTTDAVSYTHLLENLHHLLLGQHCWWSLLGSVVGFATATISGRDPKVVDLPGSPVAVRGEFLVRPRGTLVTAYGEFRVAVVTPSARLRIG